MKTYDVLDMHLGDKTDPYVAGDTREADPNEVQHLVDAGILREATGKPGGGDPPSYDYERDSLKDLALDKANKDQLLVIAAYEQADVKPEATKAQLVEAITAKRGA